MQIGAPTQAVIWSREFYQNTKHIISPHSLKNFLQMARDHLADPSLVDTHQSQDDLDEVNDI